MTATALKPDLLGALLTRITGDAKHAPSAHSTVDVLWVLYDRILRVDPPLPHKDPFDEMLLVHAHRLGARLMTRDRKLLGHPLTVQV